MLAGAGALMAMTGPAAAAPLSPDAALAALVEGNKRYLAGHLRSAGENFAALRAATENKQQPFASILACADSRVPVEFLFDQNIGRLFVVRVAGNIMTPDVIASLEFGVAVLHTPIVLVLGHTHCGAVTAAITAKPAPGQISGLYPYIQPAIERAGGDLEKAIQANAEIQAHLVARSSPVMREAINKNALKIVPAVYNLATGEVAILSGR